MVDVIAFPCIRPRQDLAQELAALPYDVFNLEEAKTEIEKNPLSFLRIDMAEATFEESIDHNDDAVFERSRCLLDSAITDGLYGIDREAHYYLYRLCAPEGHCQTGIVGCASIDDYQQGKIKKHEKTRADKELNRIRHVDVCSAQTGPIFLAYRSDGSIEQVMKKAYGSAPLYDFEADDGVRHTVWRVDDPADAAIIKNSMARTDSLYIADGHHRAASAVKAGLLRRELAAKKSTDANETSAESSNATKVSNTGVFDGEIAKGKLSDTIGALNSETPGVKQTQKALASDHFLSVIFPSNQLNILDYNRVVADLNGLSVNEFLAAVQVNFEVSEPRQEQYKPDAKGSFGMYLDGSWYKLEIKPANIEDNCAVHFAERPAVACACGTEGNPTNNQSDKSDTNCKFLPKDPVSQLDVTLLQNFLLDPILGIKDPRTDTRIDFVGGIRGLSELERRVNSGMKVAFALYPTSIDELFTVADANLLMPPKSTWFEPKLRSGIFIHRI